MSVERRVVVTGMGIITANAMNREEFFRNSVDGVTGIQECNIFDVSKLKTTYVGQIKKEMPVLQEKPDDPTRFETIAKIALDEMFEDSGIDRDTIRQYGRRAAVSLATSLASNDKVDGFIREKMEGKFYPEWLPQTPNYIPWLKKECGVRGEAFVTSPACASGTVAAGIGFDLIKQGKADIVIVGGVDHLCELSCVGFNSIGALSNSICKPFDTERDGINIGEGGAFLLFETEESAKKRNAKIYGEILGYGTGNEAYHITSPEPEGNGACAAMEMALSHTDIKKNQIDLLNAHGTGTKLNDAMETTAVEKFFGDTENELTITSNKSMIGHCLAATGTIELAATLLCIDREEYMPNISITNKMELTKNKNILTEPKKGRINYALSNSFAFAGNTASILVGRF